jgi:uncharacterized spore protein YtfJ
MANVDEMWRGVRDALTVERVFGEPIAQDGVTVVPVGVVRGGAGGGGDSEHNGGGGWGLIARPAGAYVIRGGKVAYRPAVDVNRLALFAFVLGVIALLRRG